MKAYEIQGSFGLDNLKLTDRDDPKPGPGQVVVQVKAVSLNFRDLMMVQGMYNPKQPLPLIPCSDGAGEVVAVGDGVDNVKKGDKVCGCFFQDWLSGDPSMDKCAASSLGGPIDGMLAEQVTLAAHGVVPFPEFMSFEKAATLPCAALTAWSALFRKSDLKPGDTVLTLGTGGVSIFALKMAKAAGATVIITSSSDEKLERAKKLGADHTINYKQDEQWGKTAKKITGGRGVDYVIELGGAGTLEQSLRAVRLGGHVAMIGVLSGAQQPINVIGILMQEVRVQGIFVGHRESFEDMNRALERNQIKPVISDTFSFEDAPKAFDHMAKGGHFGKIVINVG